MHFVKLPKLSSSRQTFLPSGAGTQSVNLTQAAIDLRPMQPYTVCLRAVSRMGSGDLLNLTVLNDYNEILI